ncbi:MAG: DUF1588 domain-containing protein [Lentisphaerales bacterium]|nr:DUF1588 domain-containing protein [Lentisphaerales bacterium]
MTLRIFNCSITAFVVLSAFLQLELKADQTAGFQTQIKPFMSKYCLDCHDEDTQKGDVAFHNLNGINADNSRLWKSIWEQIAVKQMPPKKKKNQPTNEERDQVAELIVNELQRVLKNKGGFQDHLHPSKGNCVNHDLLFGTIPKDLEPTSTPARIWRLHPQEHFTRLNELITVEPPYDPKKPGVRTRGDHIPADLKTGTNIYLGVHDLIGWVGSPFSLHHCLKNITPILSTKVKRGLQHYAHLYSVNSSEALRISNDAEDILRFMVYGPNAKPHQIVNDISEIEGKHRGVSTYKGRTIETNHGVPEGAFYNKKSRRPKTPVYDFMTKPDVDDKHLKGAVDYLFETLTLRKPTVKERSSYLEIVKKSIANLGKKRGGILGLSMIFLDRAALFRTELCKTGTPDKYGRVMLQDQELALAINAAFSYIAPDKKLKESLKAGRLRTREDVKKEVTRILNDDSIRKPVILRFFREYFDYDLAKDVDKDDKALSKVGGVKSKAHRQLMVEMTTNTDRLVELILQEDKNVLAELLTTDRIILSENSKNHGYYAEIDKNKKIVGKPVVSKSIEEKSVLPIHAKDWPGIVVDNSDAKITAGKWTTSSKGKDRVGKDYLVSVNETSKLVYPVNFPKAGRYEVRFSYAKRHPGCSIATLVTVRHKNGETKFRIDQKQKGSIYKRRSDTIFQSLGFFDFPAGQCDAVEVSAEKGIISKHEQASKDGKYVVADAVQFLIAGTPQVRRKQAKLIKSADGEVVNVRITEYREISGRSKSNDPLRDTSERHLVRLDTSQRKGILTHPNWLVAHSDGMDNHAIWRGKWIRERLLGGAIPDVPITVDAQLPDEPKETLRHRMRVTQEEACYKCHQKMDPLGLPFEMFNHAGLFRKTEQGKPVDSTGEITDSGDPALDGPVKNALEMIEKLARSERVKQVFIRHAFRYWIGRNETVNDAPVLQDAYKAYVENDGSMKALLTSLLTSDAFLYRKVK